MLSRSIFLPKQPGGFAYHHLVYSRFLCTVVG